VQVLLHVALCCTAPVLLSRTLLLRSPFSQSCTCHLIKSHALVIPLLPPVDSSLTTALLYCCILRQRIACQYLLLYHHILCQRITCQYLLPPIVTSHASVLLANTCSSHIASCASALLANSCSLLSSYPPPARYLTTSHTLSRFFISHP
jgi:hypothetical protein